MHDIEADITTTEIGLRGLKNYVIATFNNSPTIDNTTFQFLNDKIKMEYRQLYTGISKLKLKY